jgi:ribonuclease HI
MCTYVPPEIKKVRERRRPTPYTVLSEQEEAPATMVLGGERGGKEEDEEKEESKEGEGSIKVSGAGMILRNENGGIVFSACCQLVNCLDPLEAEARACEEGLKLALQLSDKQILMESDCAGLVTAVLETGQDRSYLTQIISEIKFLMQGTRVISFVKVDRTQNRVSHCLANLARADSRTMVWLGAGPECVHQALDLDLLVSPDA